MAPQPTIPAAATPCTTVDTSGGEARVERGLIGARRALRGRLVWVPIAIATTMTLILPVNASGAAAGGSTAAPLTATPSPVGGAAPTSGPTTVVIVGDSLAFTLAYNGLTPAMKRQIALQGAARIGCGLLTGTLLEGNREGDSQDQCGDWPQQFAAAVMTYHPAISLLLIGGWEVTDRKIDGRIYRVGTHQLEALFRDRLEVALRILTAGGARLVMLTTPCLLPAARPSCPG